MTNVRKSSKHAFERELAPHVEPTWAEEFILELRLLEVSGREIGAALSEVDSHCAESGEPAAEAFGPAKEYARSLELPADPAQRPAALVSAVLPTLAELLGLFLVVWSVPSVASGEPMRLTVGEVGTFAVLAGVILLVIWKIDPVLRAVLERPLRFILASGVAGVAIMLPTITLRQPWLDLPAVAALVVAVAFLAGGTLWELRRVLRGDDKADPIEPPLDGEEVVARSRRSARRLDYLRIFMIPVFAVLLAGMSLLLL